ncbi:hypothetical protein GCM10019071_04750 [Sphingobium fuliginis]|uniref:Uncharacterized protein n=1 Tax=Sphingobium fuliginis (strain ATCC 27551) TaxID=336203 RepID=A0ABQ1EMX1_SPHSA|nr:hypothetical protein GCM10019071_04750 [Sphingobium fuliginis]
MHEMAIDVDQAGSIGTALDDMRVPDLLIECAGLDHSDFPLDPDRTGEKGKSGHFLLTLEIARPQDAAPTG